MGVSLSVRLGRFGTERDDDAYDMSDSFLERGVG